MKIYKVKVNGKVYEVELETLSESSAKIETPKKETIVSDPVETTGATKVVAPLQGTVLNVLVKPGDKVKRGAKLLILEAMKLENEILSPTDGTIKQVLVAKGTAVNSQQPLIVIG